MRISDCGECVFKYFIRVFHFRTSGLECVLRVFNDFFEFGFEMEFGIKVIFLKSVFNIKSKLSIKPI